MLFLFLLNAAYLFVTGEWVEIVQTVAPKRASTLKPNYKTVMNPVTTDNDFMSTTLPGPVIDKRTNFVVKPPDFNTNPTETTTENTNEKNSEQANDNFIDLMKTIQNKLTQSPHKNLKNKISVLENLRNNLLNEISYRINNLFRPAEERQARGMEDEHDMHFPSHEGALMTIGFLTFGVFLIKLVLKLIYALKNKANNSQTVTIPTMAGGTTTTFIGRKKRHVNDEAVRILQLIEEFNLI